MSIVIENEPDYLQDAASELCIFCEVPTRYWNTKENKPICESCADHFNQDDVDAHEYEMLN